PGVREVLALERSGRVGAHEGGPPRGVLVDEYPRHEVAVAAKGVVVEPEQLLAQAHRVGVEVGVSPPPPRAVGVGDSDGSACAHLSHAPFSCSTSSAASWSWVASSRARSAGRGMRWASGCPGGQSQTMTWLASGWPPAPTAGALG